MCAEFPRAQLEKCGSSSICKICNRPTARPYADSYTTLQTSFGAGITKKNRASVSVASLLPSILHLDSKTKWTHMKFPTF